MTDGTAERIIPAKAVEFLKLYCFNGYTASDHKYCVGAYSLRDRKDTIKSKEGSLMTINEMKEKSFETVKRGYNPEEVQSFMKQVYATVTSMQNEKADLLKKMEVLALKVEEYKKDEESIQEALLGAQKLGKSMLAESNEKAAEVTREAQSKAVSLTAAAQRESDRILEEAKTVAQDLMIKAKNESDRMLYEAKNNVDNILKTTKYEIDKEQNSLVRMQREVSKFKTELLDLYRGHIDLIKRLPEIQDEEKKKEKEVRDLSKQIYKQRAEDGKHPESKKEDIQSETVKADLREETKEPRDLGKKETSPGLEEIKSHETAEYNMAEIKSAKPAASSTTAKTKEIPMSDEAESPYIKKFGELKFGSKSNKA